MRRATTAAILLGTLLLGFGCSSGFDIPAEIENRLAKKVRRLRSKSRAAASALDHATASLKANEAAFIRRWEDRASRPQLEAIDGYLDARLTHMSFTIRQEKETLESLKTIRNQYRKTHKSLLSAYDEQMLFINGLNTDGEGEKAMILGLWTNVNREDKDFTEKMEGLPHLAYSDREDEAARMRAIRDNIMSNCHVVETRARCLRDDLLYQVRTVSFISDSLRRHAEARVDEITSTFDTSFLQNVGAMYAKYRKLNSFNTELKHGR